LSGPAPTWIGMGQQQPCSMRSSPGRTRGATSMSRKCEWAALAASSENRPTPALSTSRPGASSNQLGLLRRFPQHQRPASRKSIGSATAGAAVPPDPGPVTAAQPLSARPLHTGGSSKCRRALQTLASKREKAAARGLQGPNGVGSVRDCRTPAPGPTARASLGRRPSPQGQRVRVRCPDAG
jgi:hypothetical protein